MVRAASMLIACVLLMAAALTPAWRSAGRAAEGAQGEEAGEVQGIAFVAYDIVIDSPAPLAAYQVEISGGARYQLVGVEGGDAGVFAEPPHYDAALLHADVHAERIVLADYSLEADGVLPVGRVLVARIHLAVTGGEDARAPAASLVVAAEGDEVRIDGASVQLVRLTTTEGDGADD